MTREENFCDDCGLDISENQMFPVSSLPIDIQTENKGGSAILCKNCFNTVQKSDPVSNTYQGSVSLDRERGILLVLSKDDIRIELNERYFIEGDEKYGIVDEEKVERIFSYLIRKGTDWVMENYWDSIAHAIREDSRS